MNPEDCHTHLDSVKRIDANLIAYRGLFYYPLTSEDSLGQCEEDCR